MTSVTLRGPHLHSCTQKRNRLLLQHDNGQNPCRQFTKGIDENANDTNLQSTRLVILQLYVSQSNNYANLQTQLVCNTPDNYLFSSVPVNNENKNLNSCFSKEQIHTRPLNLTKRKLTQRLLQVAVYVLQFFSLSSAIGKGWLYCVTSFLRRGSC